MRQANLVDRPLFTVGPCAHGDGVAEWFGPHHCQACADAVEDACRQFREAVARGEYDAQGYTPAERRALLRRAA